MQFLIKNIAAIKKAEIALGGLTVLCGESGAGKTVAATTIYGLLQQGRSILYAMLEEPVVEAIRFNPAIDLQEMFGGKLLNECLDNMCKRYAAMLPHILDTNKQRLAKASVQFRSARPADIAGGDHERSYRLQNGGVHISKAKGKTCLDIMFADGGIGAHSLAPYVIGVITDIVFAPLLPDVYMSSAERTGTILFASELDAARSKILDFMRANPMEAVRWLDSTSATNYPLPIVDGLQFTHLFASLVKDIGALAKQRPEILESFDALLGGVYKVNNGSLVFVDGKGDVFTMREASGKVRALADIGIYLRHKAKTGDVFIIDEPERSLTDNDQQKFAGVLKMLVDAGIKVLLATNSKHFIDAADTKIRLGD